MQVRFMAVKCWAVASSRIRFLVGAVLVALMPMTAWAQDGQPVPPWLEVTIVQVKAGHQADFEDRIKQLMAARAKAKMPALEIYQVVRGNLGVYHIVAPTQALAENDNPPPPPMKPEDMANLMNRLLPTLDWGRTLVARNFPEYQLQNDGDAQAKLLLLRTVHVAPMRDADFMKWVKSDLMPDLKKAKMSFTLARGTFGDSAQNFYAAEPVPDWAALDKPSPLEDMLGDKGMRQLTDKLKGIVETSEITLLRPRPDLAGTAD